MLNSPISCFHEKCSFLIFFIILALLQSVIFYELPKENVDLAEPKDLISILILILILMIVYI